jgi:hypothetical protein
MWSKPFNRFNDNSPGVLIKRIDKNDGTFWRDMFEDPCYECINISIGRKIIEFFDSPG